MKKSNKPLKNIEFQLIVSGIRDKFGSCSVTALTIPYEIAKEYLHRLSPSQKDLLFNEIIKLESSKPILPHSGWSLLKSALNRSCYSENGDYFFDEESKNYIDYLSYIKNPYNPKIKKSIDNNDRSNK